tara:strand:+ start:101 stop:592 length:492 start_codon:yes stop_codon:yes gene_type:complete
MIKVYLIIISLFFIVSCNELEFVYKDEINISNPLYEKTDVNISGLDLPFMKSYIPGRFGNKKNNDFDLLINVEEEKTKRSVETNQATSNLRYELIFNYTLRSNLKKCVVLKKKIKTVFSIIPKSSGYNFGTDTSLDKKYELSVTENIDRFISSLSEGDINNCS